LVIAVVIAPLIAEIAVAADAEIRAASAIYPDTVVVSAPTAAFGAGRLAVLR